MTSISYIDGEYGYKGYAYRRGEPVTFAIARGPFWVYRPDEVLWLAYDAAEHWSAWANYALAYEDSPGLLQSFIRRMWVNYEPYCRMQYYGFIEYDGGMP